MCALPANSVITAEKLNLTYASGVKSLEDISLTLKHGEFVSLVGPSGCGKSTLLKIIAKLLHPSSGALNVSNEKNLSFVFQAPTLLPWRSVLDNIALPLELTGLGKSERLEKARALLPRVGLEEFANAYPNQLSGGMRMRVSIARALVTDPDLLLMDEPFAALDEITREKLNSDLLDLWTKQKCTVLFVTHNVYEAAFLSTRVLVMSRRPGRIVDDIAVPFAYPRNITLRATSEFAALTGHISQSLHKAIHG
jgi:NitT/TauT family transport system ATP-binding protein